MMLRSVVMMVATLVMQSSPTTTMLMDAVRPVLPYPSATAEGDLPADDSPAAKWFVVWPTRSDDRRIIVRANPLHPDVQAASAAAMEEINAAVAAAERRAQASYDRALEQLRTTGKAGELEVVTLEDEGVAGQRIDAELEVSIELTTADSFDIVSSEPPSITQGRNGPAWVVSVPTNIYRVTTADGPRERFRAAETRLLFGITQSPVVKQLGGEPRFRVEIRMPGLKPGPAAYSQHKPGPAAYSQHTPRPAAYSQQKPGPAALGAAFSVVIRGNAQLVSALAANADWPKLAAR